MIRVGMWLLNNLKIGVKLPVVMVLIGAISLLLAEVIATGHTRDQVLASGAERLQAVSQARAAEVRRLITEIRADVRADFSNPVLLEAARAFVHAHDRYGPGVNADLRRLYIDENPNKPAHLSRLLDAGDRSSYSLVHRRYHAFFNSRISGRGYSDLYILAPDGRVVYSVRKDPLFARNISRTPSLDQNLARVFRRALAGQGFSIDILSDFTPDPMYPGALSALASIPIRSPLGTVEAVLVKRVSIDQFEATMQKPAGLGRTGRVFMAGSDQRLRTKSFGSGSPSFDLDAAESLPVRAALEGDSGIIRHHDSSGRPLLSAFAPVSIQGLRFAVVAQQSENEILTAASKIRDNMLTDGIVALSFVSVLGLVLARSMSVPLSRVEQAMAGVAKGDYEENVPDRRRRDEIGDIARRLDEFRASLLMAESTLRENAFKRAAFESTASALMLVDRELTIIHVNAALIELFRRHRIVFDRQVRDFRPDALPGRNLTTFYPGAMMLRDRLAEAESGMIELRVGQRHFEVSMSPVHDLEGARLGYVIEWADVTDQRMNDVLLEVINDRFLIADFSADGRIISANGSFMDWCGLDAIALVGRSWDWIIRGHLGSGKEAQTLRWAALVARPRGAPFSIPRAGERADSMQSTISPVRDAAGHLQRYVMVGTVNLSAASLVFTTENATPELGASG